VRALYVVRRRGPQHVSITLDGLLVVHAAIVG
jgi:hypothetical protein